MPPATSLHARTRPHGGWQRVVQAWRRTGSLNLAADSAEQRLTVERQALALLLQGRRVTLLGTVFGVPLAAWLLDDYIGNAWAWGTALAMYLIGLESGWHLRRAQRALAAHAAPGPWARGVVWRLALVGVLFNGWSWPAIDAPDFMSTIFMLSIALMVATSSMTQYCVWPAAVTAFVTPLLLGVAWRLWWVPDMHSEGRLAGGIFMVALWAMLLLAARRFAQTLHNDLITRLRNEALMAELDDKRRQAEAASTAKSRFLAAASHDLRQPVHAMQLLGAALGDQLKGTAQAPLMRQMMQGMTQFSELVDEIMDLARVDAGAVQAHIAPVPVHALLDRAQTVFRASAQARGLSFWLRQPQHTGDPAVLADAALLWRVLGNLLSNAMRYTPHGGVMLAVRRAHMHGSGQGAWRFEVRDSGPGIALEHRDAIFDEFYQAHDAARSHRGDGAGHGLGLAVAQRMARLMGTRVQLHPRSAHCSGAVFSITLPAATPMHLPAQASASPQATSQATVHLNNLPVLIVDDDPAARMALVALLQGWGARVRAAANAREAGRIAQDAAVAGQPVRALITDHWLADGIRSHDVLNAVRIHAPDVHVAVVSGGASDADQQAFASDGALFWRKPVRAEWLSEWLTALAAPALTSAETEAPPS